MYMIWEGATQETMYMLLQVQGLGGGVTLVTVDM